MPLEASQSAVEALKAAGGQVRFTIYPEAGHDSWTETYSNPELYAWFLGHSRQEAAGRELLVGKASANVLPTSNEHLTTSSLPQAPFAAITPA